MKIHPDVANDGACRWLPLEFYRPNQPFFVEAKSSIFLEQLAALKGIGEQSRATNGRDDHRFCGPMPTHGDGTHVAFRSILKPSQDSTFGACLRNQVKTASVYGFSAQHKQNQADQTRFDGIDGSYMKRRGQAVSDPNACRYERLDVLDPTAAIDFASNRQAIVGRARYDGEKKHDPVAARSRSCPSCGNFAANRRSVAATCAATLSCDRHMTQNQHRWQRAVTTACAAVSTGRKEKSHAKYTKCAFL
jgi:hypothetical protein